MIVSRLWINRLVVDYKVPYSVIKVHLVYCPKCEVTLIALFFILLC